MSSNLAEIKKLLEEVKEQFLDKDKLESYHSALSNIYAEMQFEIADLKKSRALFFIERSVGKVSDVSIKREWDATPAGLTLMEIELAVKAVSKILSSLKSRLYNVY